jgi:predicted acyltransferase
MIKERLVSLDVFRGFTVLLMTLVNNPGSWEAIYPPFEHAEWHGCTPTDLVFPFFIFILGTAIPFAMPSKTFDTAVFNKIVVRSLRIFCLGLFLNFFGKIELFGLEGFSLLLMKLIITCGVGYALMGDFTLKIKSYLVFSILGVLLFLAFSGIEAYEDVRIPGVLQRIGIVYFFVSLLYLKSKIKNQIVIALSLLVLYWGLMALVPVPGVGPANFDKGTNLAAWLDNAVLKGHLWGAVKTWDPEGILSTIPAIATGIIGMLIGQIMNFEMSKIQISRKIGIIGLLLVVAGLVWSTLFPLNKSIWSSSYVLYTAGLASLSLILLYYIIDIKNYSKWTSYFLYWGVNPMIVFFVSGIIPRVLSAIKIKNPDSITEQIDVRTYFYNTCVVPVFENPMSASLAYAILYAMFWTGILWYFYKNKMFFKV